MSEGIVIFLCSNLLVTLLCVRGSLWADLFVKMRVSAPVWVGVYVSLGAGVNIFCIVGRYLCVHLALGHDCNINFK